MSNKSRSHVPWLSRFKKRVSSPFAPSSRASSSQPCSRLSGNSIDEADYHADVVPSPASSSHRPIDSTTNPIFSHTPESSPLPPTDSPSGKHDAGRLNVPSQCAGTPNFPHASASQSPSSSSIPLPSILTPNTPPSFPTSPRTSPSPQFLLPGHNAGGLDAPGHPTDDEHSPASTSRPPSVSRPSPLSTTNRTHAGSTASPAPTQLPQDQAWNHPGPNHMFGGAHDFVVNTAVFNDYNPATDNFMEKLLLETIIGAEFDSSARDPPPRCHPGTRLAIIQRCLDFINECNDESKLRWVVGPAGVGKSAVMQMVTEAAPDDVIFASIFLSVNGRSDGKRAIITIAYQLAVKCGPYRQFIRDEIALDPSLLRKSMSVQFNKFIVEPFMHKCNFEPSRRFLVVIDGLDECDDAPIQRKLLELISDFCITYPTSPIAWIVASRPEPHITSFFDDPEVRPAFTKEEMVIDSDEACEEVQRYLRDELKKIKLAHPTLRSKREWPLEHEFTKIASAAGGLFAYAATVTRYIGDSTHRGPAAQLRRVLEIIDATVKDLGAGRNHPMDRLDLLYKRILSNVPDDAMINTRKLLLLFRTYPFQDLGFRGVCNALGLTEDDAHDAICHLHAVMKIPAPDQADEQLSYYHKSFGDFLSDFERSRFSRDFDTERSQLSDRTLLKIMEELQCDSDGVAGGEDIELWGGVMKGPCENISLSWPGDERFQMTDEEMRITLYTSVMRAIETSFSHLEDPLVKSICCFHALTIRFTSATFSFPFYTLQVCALDWFRNELAQLGKLKQMPLRALDYAAICGIVHLRFTSPTESNIEVSDPWDPSCQHDKEELNDLEERQGWSTGFKRCYQVDPSAEDNEEANIPRFYVAAHQQSHKRWVKETGESTAVNPCILCLRRFAHFFTNNPDHFAAVFVDSTQMCYVEVTFVDPDNGVSEWRYRFLHSGRPNTDA